MKNLEYYPMPLLNPCVTTKDVTASFRVGDRTRKMDCQRFLRWRLFIFCDQFQHAEKSHRRPPRGDFPLSHCQLIDGRKN